MATTTTELRERGIYTIPGYGIELIACEGDEGGWVLYDRTEWDSESQAGLEVDEDGNLTWWGSRSDIGNRTIADLVDTGHTEA